MGGSLCLITTSLRLRLREGITSSGRFARKDDKIPKGKGWKGEDRSLLMNYLLGETHKETETWQL